MKKELTDKIICLGLAGGNKTYLNEIQYQELKAKLKSGADMIIISEGTADEKIISKHAISFTMSANEVENSIKEKRGEWKCEYNFWHKKGEECGHNLEAKYKEIKT